MDFQKLKNMDIVEQFHIFGLTNVHTFGTYISKIRLFSLMLNYAKPRVIDSNPKGNFYCNIYHYNTNVVRIHLYLYLVGYAHAGLP